MHFRSPNQAGGTSPHVWSRWLVLSVLAAASVALSAPDGREIREGKEGTEPDVQEAYQQMYDLRAFPNHRLDFSAYDRAVKTLGTPGVNDWPLFYARAMTKEKLHRLDDSEADIQTALKLSPAQPELLNYLGYSWVDRGRNIPDALAMLEKARALRPSDGYIVDSVGWAYYRLGRYDDAATTLGQAVLMVPGDPTINEHFGDALWRAGRKIEARYQWYHAITFSDDAAVKAALEQKLKTGLSDRQAG